jgi:toxin ParE1/3/4
MTIEWTSSALDNLREIYSEAAVLSSPAAETVLRKLLVELDKLASLPFAGRVGRLEDTRELAISGIPLIVSYRVSNNSVQVLAVLQGASIGSES